MSESLPRVVVALVTYGHQAVLSATLDALEALEYPPDRRELVLLDNGDGACAALAAGRGIRTIVPGSNLGFAGGSNAAVASSDAEVIVLVNPDLRPRPGFLQAIVAPLADADVGAVGAKLLYGDGSTIQHAGGWLEQPRLTAQHAGWGEADDGRWDEARDVEFVTGAALAARRDVWQRLGGLDAAFVPAYYEDVDLCLRLSERGLKVRYEPRAVALHLESTALGRGSAAYHRLYHRNRLRLLWKHVSDDRLIRGWLPAELAYLRGASDDGEIDALLAAYLWWQGEFVENQGTKEPRNQGTKEPGNQGTHAAGRLGVWADAAESSVLNSQFSILNSDLSWLIKQVQRKTAPAAVPFSSRVPLLARLRGLLSRLVVAEYVRPLTQQQNDFNASAAELLAALAELTERRRRSADAAIACQAMLLAKLLGE